MPYIIAAVAAVIILWVILTYNGLIRLRSRIDEGFATMDVYLKKRYDLVPNLVETVKGYAAHEKSTFDLVVRARNQAFSAATPEEKLESQSSLSGALKSLFALAESYPELKADTQFLNLQQQLQAVETDIAQSRKYYNAVVRSYNVRCRTFPSVLIARMGGFGEKPYFEAGDDRERQPVKVEFGS